MRGTGTRRRVVPSARLPANWKGFLRVSANKAELFSLLAERIAMECVAGKQIINTFSNNVLSPQREDTSTIEPCNHEEEDTRIILHLLDAAQRGHTRLTVRTTDTDLVVLVVSQMHYIPATEVWLAFGVGKHFRYIAAHEIARQLGTPKSKALPMLHAFTGCDVVSLFYGRGKKSAWNAWRVCPTMTTVFMQLADLPTQVSEESLREIERFVVVLYDRTSALSSVNEAI